MEKQKYIINVHRDSWDFVESDWIEKLSSNIEVLEVGSTSCIIYCYPTELPLVKQLLGFTESFPYFWIEEKD